MKKIIIALLSVGILGGATVAIAHASNTSNEVVNYVYVDVKGEVANPGVYRVSDNVRVFQVIEIAGGLTTLSDTSSVNLSSKISDEQVIKIPSYTKTDSDEYISTLLNINTASASDLDTLPGIGYSLAQAIIDYRSKNGNFKAKEELKNVSGIGDAIYAQVKDYITVW